MKVGDRVVFVDDSPNFWGKKQGLLVGDRTVVTKEGGGFLYVDRYPLQDSSYCFHQSRFVLEEDYIDPDFETLTSEPPVPATMEVGDRVVYSPKSGEVSYFAKEQGLKSGDHCVIEAISQEGSFEVDVHPDCRVSYWIDPSDFVTRDEWILRVKEVEAREKRDNQTDWSFKIAYDSQCDFLRISTDLTPEKPIAVVSRDDAEYVDVIVRGSLISKMRVCGRRDKFSSILGNLCPVKCRRPLTNCAVVFRLNKVEHLKPFLKVWKDIQKDRIREDKKRNATISVSLREL